MFEMYEMYEMDEMVNFEIIKWVDLLETLMLHLSTRESYQCYRCNVRVHHISYVKNHVEEKHESKYVSINLIPMFSDFYCGGLKDLVCMYVLMIKKQSNGEQMKRKNRGKQTKQTNT